MKLSVVIATGGRWPLLAQCLKSVFSQERRPDEVLVIDNSPAGMAPAALPDGARVVREARRGVVPARNRGLDEARGEIVAFLDDDCLAPPGWLAALESCFEDPDVAAAGGPARPLWLGAPPRALLHSPRALAYLGLFDFGPRRKPLDPFREYLMGGNLAIRAACLGPGGPTLGPGKRFVGVFPFPSAGQCAEDTEMMRYLAERHCVLYEPTAWVHHQISPDKIRWHSLVARMFCIEAAAVRLGSYGPASRLNLAERVLWGGGFRTAQLLGRLFGGRLAPVSK